MGKILGRTSQIVLMTIVTLTVAALSGCNKKNEQPIQAATPSAKQVYAQAVHWELVTATVESVGTSRALKSVMLHPKISGEITEILFETGNKVKKGQALIKLDDRDIKYAIELAEVEVADTKRLLRRYEQTQGAGTVTPFELDEASSAVEQATINLGRKKNLLNDYTITAPFDGYVGLIELDIGAWVDSSTPLVSIDDRSELLVMFEVPELYFGQIKPKQTIALSLWSSSDNSIEGKIIDVASRVDADTRTFTVRAKINNSNDQLRPGMSFRVKQTLTSGKHPKLPETALQWGGNGPFVWSIVDNKAVKVPVSIVKRNSGFILLDAELEEGTLVVTEGTQRLRNGQLIHATALPETTND